MDAILDQIRAYAKDADEAGRKEILDGLRNLTYSLETPQDSIQRIIFYVRSSVLSYDPVWRLNFSRISDSRLLGLVWT